MRTLFLSLLLLAGSSLPGFSQIVLDRGSVQINLKYGGQPASQAAPGFYVTVSMGPYSAGMFDDSTTLSDLAPGSYTMEVRVSPSNAVAATYPVTVTGGNQTVVNIELNTFTGVYFGKLMVNGQPGSGFISCPSTGAGCISTDGAGIFKHLAAVGANTGYIRGANGIILNYSYTVSAGQAIDIGTFTYSIGSVQINLKYNGQPVSQAAPGFYVTLSFGSYVAGMFDDSTSIPEVVPANYSMAVRVSPSNAVLKTIPFTVAAGAPTTVDVELSDIAGVYFGKLLVNGQPGSGFVSCPSTGAGCIGTDGGGNFKHLVAAGSGTGYIRGSNGTIVNYNYTVAAGQTVDIGTLTYSIGSVQINLKYGGQPASQAAPGFYVTISFGSYVAGMFDDSTTVPEVAPGSYSLQVRVSPSNAVLATYPITVTAGTPTVVNIDLCGIAGIIRGTLLVNGQPGSGYISCPSTGAGCISVGSNGEFSHIVAAGLGSGYIRGDNGISWYYAYKAVGCTTSAIGDPTALNVIQARSNVAVTAPNRTWTMRYTNYGAGPAPLNLTGFTLTHVSGPVCTPTVQTPLGIPLGTIQPNANGTTNIVINFSGCAATSRFRVNSTVNNGANTFTLPPFFSFY
jgi:hypothetical protein